MMNGGSTLLLTLCEPPSNDIVGLGRTKQPSMKRRNEDIGIQSCLSSNSEYALPSTKKLRRYVSTESRSSKLRWRPVLEDQQDGSLVSRHRMIKEGGEELESSEVTPMDTWYSKEEYKQMMLDQSLTVHIMRSLRFLAGEEVGIDYCDEIDSDYSRFDELIKKHQIDSEEYCERGLESYLSEERRNEVNASRKLHKLLVIGEYVRQGMLGTSDPELVRNVSMSQSKKSFERSQKLGLVDQREARAIEKSKQNKSQKESEQKHLPLKQNMKLIVKKKMDHILTKNLHSPIVASKSINTSLRNIPGKSLDNDQPNQSRFALIGIRDDVMKQQGFQLLMKQQQEQSQLAQYQLNFEQRNMNAIAVPDDSSFLASLQMQELERLFHQKQQEQQIQIQRNYETQVQRLLLLQQQQRQYESMQLVSAAILGQHKR